MLSNENSYIIWLVTASLLFCGFRMRLWFMSGQGHVNITINSPIQYAAIVSHQILLLFEHSYSKL